MKRFFAFVLCFLFLLTLIGCRSIDLKSGYYLADNYEGNSTPYVYLSFENNSFSFSNDLAMSYAERGNFVIKGNKITATTQNTIFVFKIKDSSLIELIDCNGFEPFTNYEGSVFTYRTATALS